MSYSEVEEAFCLTDDGKYKFFLHLSAESEMVCGLKDKKGGWVTTKDSEGIVAMPLWPSYEFAKYCQENQWKETDIESIDLFEFLEYWLSDMKRDGCRVLVMADTAGGGVSVDAAKLKIKIQEFLSKR